jgi:hypothetical protein
VPFELYPYQEKLAKTYEDNDFVIVKKFRQGGFTTLIAIWCLWNCLFKHNQQALIVSNSFRNAQNLGEMINTIVKFFPDWMKCLVDRSTKNEQHVASTNSWLGFYSWEASRGKGLTHLVIDEAAFLQGLDRKWKEMYPSLSTGGKCIAVSTVNGPSGWFFETWFKAIEGKTKFKAVNIDYWEHPEYNNVEWVKGMRERLGEAGWQQEVLGNFIIE